MASSEDTSDSANRQYQMNGNDAIINQAIRASRRSKNRRRRMKSSDGRNNEITLSRGMSLDARMNYGFDQVGTSDTYFDKGMPIDVIGASPQQSADSYEDSNGSSNSDEVRMRPTVYSTIYPTASDDHAPSAIDTSALNLDGMVYGQENSNLQQSDLDGVQSQSKFDPSDMPINEIPPHANQGYLPYDSSFNDPQQVMYRPQEMDAAGYSAPMPDEVASVSSPNLYPNQQLPHNMFGNISDDFVSSAINQQIHGTPEYQHSQGFISQPSHPPGQTLEGHPGRHHHQHPAPHAVHGYHGDHGPISEIPTHHIGPSQFSSPIHPPKYHGDAKHWGGHVCDAGCVPHCRFRPVLNCDPHPKVIHKPAPFRPPVYNQKIIVKYMKPPLPGRPGPIIIQEKRPPQPPPQPPLVIKNVPKKPCTPPPLIIRECPPRPPPIPGTKLITKLLPQIPPPPRQVIVERYPPLPPKPRDIVFERWLPYDPLPKRQVIWKKAKCAVIQCPPKNLIIQYHLPKPKVIRQYCNLGVSVVRPEAYMASYGNCLLPREKVECLAQNVGLRCKQHISTATSCVGHGAQFPCGGGDIPCHSPCGSCENLAASPLDCCMPDCLPFDHCGHDIGGHHCHQNIHQHCVSRPSCVSLERLSNDKWISSSPTMGKCPTKRATKIRSSSSQHGLATMTNLTDNFPLSSRCRQEPVRRSLQRARSFAGRTSSRG